MNEKLLEEIGQLIDSAENYMALNEVPMPLPLKNDGLLQGVVELRDGMRVMYERHGGNCDDVWTLGPYK